MVNYPEGIICLCYRHLLVSPNFVLPLPTQMSRDRILSSSHRLRNIGLLIAPRLSLHIPNGINGADLQAGTFTPIGNVDKILYVPTKGPDLG